MIRLIESKLSCNATHNVATTVVNNDYDNSSYELVMDAAEYFSDELQKT